MTSLLVWSWLAVSCIVVQGAENRSAVDGPGNTRTCTDADLAARESLTTLGIAARAGIASPTRAPWIDANGWRFLRRPDAKYVYTVPAGKAALAAAEAFAYGVDAALKIDPGDAQSLAAMLTFLAGVPPTDLPPVADFAVVDDGSPITGEVMNLLVRRNLLFQVVREPSTRLPITVAVGSAEYPRAEAADPSAFAQKIRRQLTDERRALRIYGSGVVSGRLTGDGTRTRLDLLNYGGRDIEGLRIRLRGAFRPGTARIAGVGSVALADQSVADGATEFSLPR